MRNAIVKIIYKTTSPTAGSVKNYMYFLKVLISYDLLVVI